MAAGAARLGAQLTPAQIALFQRYAVALAEWNQRLNLTAIRDPEEVLRRHFLDSLAGVAELDGLAASAATEAMRVVDVGSGAGFPCLALKIARPQHEVTLIESTAKRCRFLEWLIQDLALERVQVMAARAEDAGRRPEAREAFDLALCRALGTLALVAELCLPLVRPGGRLLAYKGPRVAAEVEDGAAAAAVLGARLTEVRPVPIPGLQRHLVIFAKESPTPARFPRRPGMASKRPLAASGPVL